MGHTGGTYRGKVTFLPDKTSQSLCPPGGIGQEGYEASHFQNDSFFGDPAPSAPELGLPYPPGGGGPGLRPVSHF